MATVVNHIRYDSFGKITSETNAAVDFLFAYTGRERDKETGLYYYRARYYDPAVGRFVSEDLLGFAARDVNLVRYVSNAPITFTDPTGNEIKTPIPRVDQKGKIHGPDTEIPRRVPKDWDLRTILEAYEEAKQSVKTRDDELKEYPREHRKPKPDAPTHRGRLRREMDWLEALKNELKKHGVDPENPPWPLVYYIMPPEYRPVPTPDPTVPPISPPDLVPPIFYPKPSPLPPSIGPQRPFPWLIPPYPNLQPTLPGTPGSWPSPGTIDFDPPDLPPFPIPEPTDLRPIYVPRLEPAPPRETAITVGAVMVGIGTRLMYIGGTASAAILADDATVLGAVDDPALFVSGSMFVVGGVIVWWFTPE
jgi:RHS repeat-associated protein